MELRIGGNEVFLSLGRAFYTADENALLQQVSRFKPLIDYLTTFKPQDFTISLMSVAAVSFIANRISDVTLDVTLKHKTTKENLQQVLTVAEETRTVVLPVMLVGNTMYAALVQRPRVAAGGHTVVEAFAGDFAKDGTFNAEGKELLDAVGFQISEKSCTALTKEDISLGDEGQGPVRILKASKAFSQQSFDEAFGGQPVTSGSSKLIAVPLESVAAESTDMKAVLAASLALAGKS